MAMPDPESSYPTARPVPDRRRDICALGGYRGQKSTATCVRGCTSSMRREGVGRVIATIGLAIMIVTAVVSGSRIQQLAGTGLFSDDVIAGVAVLAGCCLALAAGYLAWLRRPAAGWLLIIVSFLALMCISNVELTTVIDGSSVSSQTTTGRVVAAVGALLLIIGALWSRSGSLQYRMERQPATKLD